MLFADAVGLQLLELGLQVPGIVIGLADPGVPAGDCNHGTEASLPISLLVDAKSMNLSSIG